MRAIVSTENGTPATVTNVEIGVPAEGEVLVAISHSSLNYKDGTAIAGGPGVVRKWPLMLGIDAVGVVVESRAAAFSPGQALDARASFERIGTVLGVSDQTVARRYRRLVDQRAVAIRAVPITGDSTAQGWFVRLRCAPPQTRSIADQLSARDDTRWVMLTSGGTEVVFLLHVEGQHTAPSVRDALLSAPHTTPGILGVEAYSPLRFFVGHQVAWQARMSALTPTEIDALAGTETTPPPAHDGLALDDFDQAIVNILADDGRASIARVALHVGASESSVRRRVDRLLTHSLIYFDVVIDERVLGYQELTLVWLQIPLNRLDDLGHRVAAHAPVAMPTAMSGNDDLLIAAASHNRDDLYDDLTGELAQTIGSATFRTSPVLELVKRG